MMLEAMLYERLGENRVVCILCNHHCKIREGKRGICGVRENRGGILYSLVYPHKRKRFLALTIHSYRRSTGI